MFWNICFLPCWFGAEIKITLQVALPKQPTNKFQLDQQSRQQALRAYCPNINTVCIGEDYLLKRKNLERAKLLLLKPLQPCLPSKIQKRTV